jgi:hypothetical protein
MHSHSRHNTESAQNKRSPGRPVREPEYTRPWTGVQKRPIRLRSRMDLKKNRLAGHDVSTWLSHSLRSLSPSPQNTADQLRSGAPVRPAGGGTGRHLSLQYGCRPELRQLHPLVRRRRSLGLGLGRLSGTGGVLWPDEFWRVACLLGRLLGAVEDTVPRHRLVGV